MRSLDLIALVGCSAPAMPPAVTTPPPTVAKGPLALTYLGVAGWQLDSGDSTILVDPYFSRPNLDGPIAPDAAAIARRAPKRAKLIVIGHSHVDHLLDAPAVAVATGAEILGSATTARVARASGVPADHVITVKGGEDFAFDGFSVRVIPSLHSALDRKHVFGGSITGTPALPILPRLRGRRHLHLPRAHRGPPGPDRQHRELHRARARGTAPDIAIIAPGLRQEIHDYTCRLLRTLGNPPVDWHAPPPDKPDVSDDTHAFVAEVAACCHPRRRPDTLRPHVDPARAVSNASVIPSPAPAARDAGPRAPARSMRRCRRDDDTRAAGCHLRAADGARGAERVLRERAARLPARCRERASGRREGHRAGVRR